MSKCVLTHEIHQNLNVFSENIFNLKFVLFRNIYLVENTTNNYRKVKKQKRSSLIPINILLDASYNNCINK